MTKTQPLVVVDQEDFHVHSGSEVKSILNFLKLKGLQSEAEGRTASISFNNHESFEVYSSNFIL